MDQIKELLATIEELAAAGREALSQASGGGAPAGPEGAPAPEGAGGPPPAGQ